jgi:hypothetical protein
MAYVEDRFGRNLHGAFQGKVRDRIGLPRQWRQRPEPFKIADDVAQVSKASHHHRLAHGHGVVPPASAV